MSEEPPCIVYAYTSICTGCGRALLGRRGFGRRKRRTITKGAGEKRKCAGRSEEGGRPFDSRFFFGVFYFIFFLKSVWRSAVPSETKQLSQKETRYTVWRSWRWRRKEIGWEGECVCVRERENERAVESRGVGGGKWLMISPPRLLVLLPPPPHRRRRNRRRRRRRRRRQRRI